MADQANENRASDKGFRTTVLELAKTTERLAREGDTYNSGRVLQTTRFLLEDARAWSTDLGAWVLMAESTLRLHQGRTTSASNLYDRACALCQRVLGNSHAFTLACQGHHGKLLIKLGEESGKDKLTAALAGLPTAITDEHYGPDYVARQQAHFSELLAHADEMIILGRVDQASKVRG